MTIITMMQEHKSRADQGSHEEGICWDIVEAVNSIILRWDTDLKVTFINRYALEFFGYSRDRILGMSLIGTIVPERSATGKNLKAMIEDIVRHPDRYVNNENENLRHDGTRVWISWTNRAIKDRQGHVREIISVGNDITARKRAEEALQRQLEMTQTLLDAIPIPVFYKDTRGVYLGCNRAFAGFLGTTKDRIVGRTVYDVAPPDLAAEYDKQDQELFRHPGSQNYESTVVDARGKRHDVAFFKATYLNKDSTVAGVIGTIIDITERKAMWQELERRVLERTKELERANVFLRREAAEHREDEEALRESEERFRAVFEQAGVGIGIATLDGKLMRLNDTFCRFTGYSCEELIGHNYREVIYPEDVEIDREEIRRMLSEEITSYSVDKRYVRKDGKVIWGNVTVSMVRDPGGRPQYVVAIVQDITGRKQAEEAQRGSEERFRVLVEASPAAIFFHQGGNFIYVNPAAERMTGYSKDQLLHMKFWEIIAPEDRAMVRECGMGRLSGKKPLPRYEAKFLTSDGSERWIDLSATPMEFRGRRSILAIALDVTQRRQAEEAITRARSRAELYLDLMGHDITNMNQAMMGYLEIAREVLELKGHEELIDQPLEIIRHSSRLIASVKKLELAQSGKYRVKIIDLDPVLKQVIGKYSKVPGREVTINYIPAEGCYVRANDLLKDVFENLVDNAIRHSEGPVRVDILVEPVLQEGRTYYRISVADNGPGIPEDLKKNIFRFIDIATGAPGRRGLGLFMVRTLVASYGGRVWVEDRVSGDYHKGSRFVVLLPAANK